MPRVGTVSEPYPPNAAVRVSVFGEAPSDSDKSWQRVIVRITIIITTIIRIIVVTIVIVITIIIILILLVIL